MTKGGANKPLKSNLEMPSGVLQKFALIDLNYLVMIWAGRVGVCSSSMLADR